MSDEQQRHPKNKRSGSDNRQRDCLINFRVSVEEHDEIKARAVSAGLTVGSFLRSLAFPASCPRPVVRRFRRLPPLTWPAPTPPGGRP